MEQDQVSLTAMMTAYIRAFHAMHDAPKVFDDFLARRLLPPERIAAIEQGIAEALQLGEADFSALLPGQLSAIAGLLQFMGASNVLSRSRYTEEKLQHALHQGIKQYVILGAGLDTFAFRRPELMGQLQVFEVDHPATQAFKVRRLEELGWAKPLQLHFVPVDFQHDDLINALRQSCFDPQAPSFFSWLGVTMYLSRDEVFATLHDIAHGSPPGSTIIFDYHDTGVSNMQRSLTQQAGEPMKSCFDPSALALNLANSGFRLREDVGPADIEARYFSERVDGYHAAGHVHLAYAAVE